MPPWLGDARLHGGEGIWLPISDACLGYTQVSAMADAYLHEARFDALPRAPTNLRAHGAWARRGARSVSGLAASPSGAALATCASAASVAALVEAIITDKAQLEKL